MTTRNIQETNRFNFEFWSFRPTKLSTHFWMCLNLHMRVVASWMNNCRKLKKLANLQGLSSGNKIEQAWKDYEKGLTQLIWKHLKSGGLTCIGIEGQVQYAVQTKQRKLENLIFYSNIPECCEALSQEVDTTLSKRRMQKVPNPTASLNKDSRN